MLVVSEDFCVQQLQEDDRLPPVNDKNAADLKMQERHSAFKA